MSTIIADRWKKGRDFTDGTDIIQKMFAKNQTPVESKLHPLDQVLKSLDEALGFDAAKAVAELELEPEVKARIDQLADMSAAGSLTEAERAEYLEFVEAIDLLSIFQARARNAISRQNSR